MSDLAATLFAGVIGLWWLFGVALAFVIGVLFPLMVLSVTRNVKGINRELRRLNDNLEQRGAPYFEGSATHPHGDDRAANPPNYYTRTGPLNIR